MPVPLQIIVKITQWVVRVSPRAFKEAVRMRKFEEKWFGRYRVEIQRRASLGRDSGISQMISIVKDNVTEQVWHIVVKAGKVIHKHLYYERK